VSRERDFNAWHCPRCHEEVGMMGHGPAGCPAEKAARAAAAQAKPALRAFLAHPKDLDDYRIDALRDLAIESMREAIAIMGGGREPHVVTGRDDFNANVMTAGGWEAWTYSVARGSEYRNGVLQPRFDIIILTPGPLFGKATAGIIEAALTHGRPCFLLPGDEQDEDLGMLYPITHVIVKDPRNFRTGYTVRYGASIGRGVHG
jgi:hypothetical protein